MMHNVLHAPMNYFDENPLSRTLNIFTKDMNQIEILMPFNLSSFMGFSYQLLSIGAVAVLAHYYMIVLIPFVVVMCIDTVRTCLPAIKDTGKL